MSNSEPKKYDIYSVTRLNREVKAVIEGSFPAMWVKGEISNLARPASGHLYFSLKDANSQVRCAMFRGRNRLLKFTPENGEEVLMQVNVSLYEGRGEFQLIVEHMEPAGAGALQRAFEELKQKLFNEGLFAQEQKKPLPNHPQSIGIITSASGAAIRDILNVLKRRYPLTSIIIYPVPVQGEGAAQQISEMLQTVIKRAEVDVIILSRGGGSIEDLWAFNDENLARLIFSCPIPLVTGIGHEIDFTIADFIADVRAPTPSAAAELVCPDIISLKQSIDATEHRLGKLVTNLLYEFTMKLEYLTGKLLSGETQISHLQNRLKFASKQLFNLTGLSINKNKNRLDGLNRSINTLSPRNQLKTQTEKLNFISKQLLTSYYQQQIRRIENLSFLNRSLEMMNPLAILNRGYSVVKKADGSVVQHVKQLVKGDNIEIILSDGSANAAVKNTLKNPK